MKVCLLLGVLALLSIGGVFSSTDEQEVSYEGYKLVSVSLKSQQDVNVIQELEANPDFDLWGSIKKHSQDVKVLMSEPAFDKYSKLFHALNMDHEVIDHNIQDKIDNQKRSMKRRSTETKNIVGKFARYSEIVNFLDEKLQTDPDLVQVYSAGFSYENRSIPVIRISTPTSQRVIWIDCGIHSREWISPSTCVWIIDKLIQDFKAGVADTVDLLKYYEFHILPVLNPDGYEFTHTTNRMWRKNRRPNPGSTCIGTDLNRNYGYQWSLPGGSSDSPCSEIYRGPSADSEPETKAVESTLSKLFDRMDAYLTLHTPVGYTYELPTNYDLFYNKTKLGAEAISSVYKSGIWTYGSAPLLLYITTGSSDDWAWGVGKIQYSHCLELRPGDSGPDSGFGFTLPEDRAPLAGQETYIGIKAFVSSIKADALGKKTVV